MRHIGIVESHATIKRLEELAEGFKFRDFKFEVSERDNVGWPVIVLTCQWIAEGKDIYTGMAHVPPESAHDEMLFMYVAKSLIADVIFKAMDAEARISLSKA